MTSGGLKLKSIINYLKTLSTCKMNYFYEVVKLYLFRLILSERSFSALRCLKTWVRSTMHQTRLNWCMVLHAHSDETDELNLQGIL